MEIDPAEIARKRPHFRVLFRNGGNSPDGRHGVDPAAGLRIVFFLKCDCEEFGRFGRTFIRFAPAAVAEHGFGFGGIAEESADAGEFHNHNPLRPSHSATVFPMTASWSSRSAPILLRICS